LIILFSILISAEAGKRKWKRIEELPRDIGSFNDKRRLESDGID